MMSRSRLASAAAMVAAFAPTPIWAASSCHDDIASLEQRLDKEAASAGAAQGSGQKDAAVRSSKAVEAKKTDTSIADLPRPPSPENIAGSEASAAANTAGEGVMAAKVSLNDARNADKKGDEAGCRKAYDAARREAGS